MADHVVYDTQNQQLFCAHCGTGEAVKMPVAITAMASSMKGFDRLHRGCPKPDVLFQPGRPNRDLPVPVGALAPWPGLANWLKHGEVGISSLTLAAAVTGLPLRDGTAGAPRDAGDFRRCVGLLEAAPALREGLGQARRALGPGWAALLDHWPELERLGRSHAPDAYEQLTDRIRRLSNG